MKGGGPVAWLIGRRVEQACERLGLNAVKKRLTTELFTPPLAQQKAAQLNLFENV